MVTESELRRLCLGLPGTHEQSSYNGTPSFRTKARVFARLLDDGERVALWVSDEDEKLARVAAEPAIFSTTPHYDGYPMVLVSLGAVDVELLRGLVNESFRLRAPTKLLADVPPAQGPGPAPDRCRDGPPTS